ncbi:single hybrid motif-containing protein [Bisporella sp. PMI_857]|nr:single hybrid motif-containing protein [Bisporella sp. PMI_857]KAH8600323.1 single hybrid motif-containing protein [Bisporella sp. PMI_857]
MASIARSLRPMAMRLAVRPCVGSVASWKASSRAFSVTALYTKDHEWVEISEDKKTGYIGISDYAAHALGDVVYVELPTVPMDANKGDAIGAVESVKSASDINSPISCTITAVNDSPEDDGASGGWIAKIEVSEAGIQDIEDLMDAEAYKKFTEEA